MASYSLVFILMLLFVINIDSRRLSRKHQSRHLWQNMKEKLKQTAINKFYIDTRQFDKEEMLLFPDVAYQSLDNDNIWNIMIHGWRYDGSKRKGWLGSSFGHLIEKLVMQLLGTEETSALNGTMNRDRLKPFLVSDESNELVTIQIGEKTYPIVTDGNGEFYQPIQITNDEIQKLKQQQQTGSKIIYEALGDIQDKTTGTIQVIEPRQGISIISDIDDTIKISEVLDKIRLIANTFIYPFKPVPGMPELYQKWRSNNNNCTFHYLSGMPDQLYTLTQEFIDTNNFPDGSFHMRHFGWAAGSLFKFLHAEGTFIHKINYLVFFLSNTIRDFVLVGDSGERDPEIYGTIAREYPQRIRAIFIRAIQGETFDDSRFLSAFQGIPAEKWQIYNDPNQLPIDLSRSPRPAAG